MHPQTPRALLLPFSGALGLLLLWLALAAAPGHTQAGDAEPPAGNAFSGQREVPVTFRHATHLEEAGIAKCTTCHHVYEGGQQVPGSSSAGTPCSDCHESGEARPEGKHAFHAMCINCHHENESAPLRCTSCHPGYSPERITDLGFRTKQRPRARFDHIAHTQEHGVESCSVCHHLYSPSLTSLTYSIPGQECSECHLLDMEHSPAVPDLQDSYHQMCLDCHQSRGEGPLACGECHVKE